LTVTKDFLYHTGVVEQVETSPNNLAARVFSASKSVADGRI